MEEPRRRPPRIFPAGRLRLRLRRRLPRIVPVAIASALGALMVLIAVLAIYQEGKSITRDVEVWERGLHGSVLSWNAQEDDGDYDVYVVFLDDEGEVYEGFLEFDLIASRVDTSQEPVVRYDPANPADFTIDWAVDHSTLRWVTLIAYMSLGFGFFIAILFAVARYFYVKNAVVAGVARSRHEDTVDYRPEDWVHNSVTGFHRWKCLGPSGKITMLNFDKAPPIFVDAERTQILALRSVADPDGAIVIPRGDLSPFELSPQQRAELEASMEARGLTLYASWDEVPAESVQPPATPARPPSYTL